MAVGNSPLFSEPLFHYVWMGVAVLFTCQATVKFKWEHICTAPSSPPSMQLPLNLQKWLLNSCHPWMYVPILSPILGCTPSPASGAWKLTQIPTSSGVRGSIASVSQLTRPVPAASSCLDQAGQRRSWCCRCSPSVVLSSSAPDPPQKQIVPPGASLGPSQWSSGPPGMGSSFLYNQG